MVAASSPQTQSASSVQIEPHVLELPLEVSELVDLWVEREQRKTGAGADQARASVHSELIEIVAGEARRRTV